MLCPYCRQNITGGELTLSAHMREVHPQYFPQAAAAAAASSPLPKPHPCTECPAGFATKVALQEHHFLVHKEKSVVFQCLICYHSCISYDRMLTHYVSEHGMSADRPVEAHCVFGKFRQLPTCSACGYSNLLLFEQRRNCKCPGAATPARPEQVVDCQLTKSSLELQIDLGFGQRTQLPVTPSQSALVGDDLSQAFQRVAVSNPVVGNPANSPPRTVELGEDPLILCTSQQAGPSQQTLPGPPASTSQQAASQQAGMETDHSPATTKPKSTFAAVLQAPGSGDWQPQKPKKSNKNTKGSKFTSPKPEKKINKLVRLM